MEQWGQGVGGGLVILVGFSPISPSGREYLKKYRRKEEPKKKKNDTRPQCSSSCLLFLFSLSALPKKNTPFLWKKKYPFGHAPRTGPPRFCSFLGHWCGFFCLVLVMFFFGGFGRTSRFVWEPGASNGGRWLAGWRRAIWMRRPFLFCRFRWFACLRYYFARRLSFFATY